MKTEDALKLIDKELVLRALKEIDWQIDCQLLRIGGMLRNLHREKFGSDAEFLGFVNAHKEALRRVRNCTQHYMNNLELLGALPDASLLIAGEGRSLDEAMRIQKAVEDLIIHKTASSS